MRVYILQEVVPHFRINFLKYLSSEIDLTLLFSYPTKKKNRNIPDLKELENVKYYLTHGISIWGGMISIHSRLIAKVINDVPDVLILENRLGFLTAVILYYFSPRKVKIIWWLSGYESSKTKFMRSFKRILNKMLYKKADGFICYSTAGKKYLENLGITNNIHIAYNSIDTKVILDIKEQYSKHRDQINRDDSFIILSTGRLEKYKKYDLIIKAISTLINKIPNIKYYCIGKGDSLHFLLELAKEESVNDIVFFPGEKTNEIELCEYFENSDIYIMPGTGGLALNHALAYGKAIIASEGDGSQDDIVIENYNGLYFNKNDYESLANKIYELYLNREKLKLMAENSLILCQNKFNIGNMISGFIKCIKQALDEN